MTRGYKLRRDAQQHMAAIARLRLVTTLFKSYRKGQKLRSTTGNSSFLFWRKKYF